MPVRIVRGQIVRGQIVWSRINLYRNSLLLIRLRDMTYLQLVNFKSIQFDVFVYLHLYFVLLQASNFVLLYYIERAKRAS